MNTPELSRFVLLLAGQNQTFAARRGTVIICAEGKLRLAAPDLAWQGNHEIAAMTPSITLHTGQSHQLTQGGVVTIQAERTSRVYCVVPAPFLLFRAVRALIRAVARLPIVRDIPRAHEGIHRGTHTN